ncbi:MAG: cell division protein FtsQ/DivIB [Phycisphaerales bacterium]
MSWFLGSSKKKKPKRQWVKQAKQTSTWDPARWYPLLRVTFVVGVFVLLGFGYVMGRETLMHKVGLDEAAKPDVRFVQVPAWMPPAHLERMKQQMAGVISNDPLDRQSLATAEHLLADNPWVRQVVRVERYRAGRVLVLAYFREPAALVGAKDGFHLIDAQAHRLPGVYTYDQLQQLGLPAITGCAAAPPTQGQLWPGADIVAALRLARLLMDQPFADQVRSIDVANYGGRDNPRDPHLLIKTSGGDGGMVRWGRAPGEEGIYEPNAQKKLAMLRRVAASARGAIDAGGCTVDVFTDQPLSHSPAEQVRYTVEQ